MSRIELKVPFADKDEAKRLGARWDSERKVWYVPDGVEANAFSRWMQSEPDITVRSSSYFIAQTTKLCWRCSKSTSVFGFMLPVGHESLEYDDEDEEPDTWYRHEEPTIVHYVNDLLPAVAARIKALTRHYRIDFSKTTKSSYWMNHCEHCGMKQGDFDMYCEPRGAFYPMDEVDASLILLHKFAEPFGCTGSRMYGDFPFEHMRRT